ncbi:MAG TPA: acylphosphatase [Polyangia bacterium]
MLESAVNEDAAWEQQPARWNIQVNGTVEGVGFRAFVYTLATRLNLRGFVASQPGTLAIEIEGARASLGEFLEELWLGAPRRAHIDQLSCHSGPPQGAAGFQIVGKD